MKKVACPVDGVEYAEFGALEDHFETEHPEEAARLETKGVTLKQHMFNVRNRYDPWRTRGRSIVSGKPTEWNEGAGRYNRIRPEEKGRYREMFKRNMVRVHGKSTILDDPEGQRKAQAGRSITGRFRWDAKHSFEHMGTYELDFLRHLRDALGWSPEDVLMPSDVTAPYKDPETGKRRFYMPDAHLPSIGLLVEVKAGDNNHYRRRDLRVEAAKDDAASKLRGFRYIKILDKNYEDFDRLVEERNP